MYKEPLYRPPSEAESIIIQITEGCSHNKCKFCTMYKQKKFRCKTHDEISEHIAWLKKYYNTPKRIFLADGNVLCLSTDKLLSVLDKVKEQFPSFQRISSYAGPLDILRKSDDELKSVRAAGVELLYMGVESGSDEILSMMNKGVTQQEMIEAGQKAIRAGFKLSCMIISGLGGTKLITEHAIESAKVISAINPDYFSLLRLVVEEKSELSELIKNGEFNIATPKQILEENIIMLEHLELHDCIFRANHVSNHVNQAGILNKDKELLLDRLKKFRDSDDFVPMRYDIL